MLVTGQAGSANAKMVWLGEPKKIAEKHTPKGRMATVAVKWSTCKFLDLYILYLTQFLTILAASHICDKSMLFTRVCTESIISSTDVISLQNYNKIQQQQWMNNIHWKASQNHDRKTKEKQLKINTIRPYQTHSLANTFPTSFRKHFQSHVKNGVAPTVNINNTEKTSVYQMTNFAPDHFYPCILGKFNCSVVIFKLSLLKNG